MMKITVCKKDELRPGDKKVINVNKRSILVVCKSPEEIYAIRDVCPHQGAPLSKGSFSGTVDGDEVGEYRYVREHEIVRCPWHGFEFEAKTGCSLHDPRTSKVKTYPVYVENDSIILEISER